MVNARFIDPGAITLEALSLLLEGAGIDHELADQGSIYVTGVAFPLWVHLDGDHDGILLSTHWLLSENVDEIEALRFVNALNCEMLMVQFSLPDPARTLWGQYWLSCRHGMAAVQFLRSLHRFSGCFAEAMKRGRGEDILRGSVEGIPAVLH